MDTGDLLLAYSDGVVEAQSPDGEFFGEERLARVLASCDPAPSAAVAAVLEAVDEFAGDTPPYDDITLVAARWVGPASTGETRRGPST